MNKVNFVVLNAVKNDILRKKCYYIIKNRAPDPLLQQSSP